MFREAGRHYELFRKSMQALEGKAYRPGSLGELTQFVIDNGRQIVAGLNSKFLDMRMNLGFKFVPSWSSGPNVPKGQTNMVALGRDCLLYGAKPFQEMKRASHFL